jgi:HK97 family phage major capsid protein
MHENSLPSLKDSRNQHFLAATKLVDTAKANGKDLGAIELQDFNIHMAAMRDLDGRIYRAEQNSGTNINTNLNPGSRFGHLSVGASAPRGQTRMSEGYSSAFLAFLRSGGRQASAELSEGFDSLFGGFALPAMPRAALSEGNAANGGYAVSVPTDPTIIPLGMPDLGVRSVARIIVTETDVKIPAQASFSTAAVKLESGDTTHTFTESNPTLSQITLSAFMCGLSHTVSWELLQDLHLFQDFAVADLLSAISILEDGFFVSGSGTNQPQGLIGNVGTGTGSAYALESTGAYLLGAVMDVQSSLKSQYFANAAWLMNRATATAIRKAQQQANLFANVWSRENGRDYLLGFPVAYAQSMPDLPSATTAGVTPLLFGDFQSGYVIGDRGSSGTFIKVLDQPLATSGQTILLGYKRVDGRVRRSEAIQGISVSHS